GQSAPEGRTVRARSRELAEALVGWRTVRPRVADSPAQSGEQSATVPESLQRLWWVGGQSGPEWRTVRPRVADSPAQSGGQSATVPESLQCLWWARGRSGPGGRTVRHCFSILYQRGCFSGLGSKVKLRT